MINVENVIKSYGDKEVLRGVSFVVEPGTVCGLVGENGAGKTTLFRCLAGLEPCDGEIHSSMQPLKNSLGFLSTEPYFFPRMTGREYLRLLCEARGKSAEALDQRNVFDLPLDRYAEQYSTGMKKKLALTGILLQENSFFILDEPFNGVDLASNWMITDIILELKRLGKTLLISSHIFVTLQHTCDKIVHLQDGLIAEEVPRDSFDQFEAKLKGAVRNQGLERLRLS